MHKILVIDDDALLRQTIALVLKARGHQIIEAENGLVGIQMARSQQPDLIISDVNMPECDGYQVLEALRADSTTTNIPFVFMTGQADDEGMRRGMIGGADDYLPKPFAMDALLATVDARLRKETQRKAAADKRLAELRSNLSLMLPHELNTPLIGILGFGEIIISCADSLSPEELVEMGQSIVTSGQRLQHLIQNFLLYSQLELLGADARDVSLMRNKYTTAAHELIAELLQRRADAGNRAGDLKLELTRVEGAISAELLSKIVEELADNAFKFSQPGQAVRVTARMDAGTLELTITDGGRGFKAEHIGQISAYLQFERRQHEQQGSGLGLIIAKRLAELHGGSLTIHSDGRTGTTVVVRLPAAIT